eukprot:TRINITY_DN17513_c0_g1_i1.p1 TRINITY_DN17513_c0_g1~~TRINITY_DN17513_c0_g1_i1.p1  ORF type:complete len:381 (-),score=93.02 TRINITY_DN17513_c0_g1_i1:68-1210(-)
MNKNFLSKKSWHTGSIKHIEKVWKAEQRHETEQKAISIWKKEKDEENRRYEMKKLSEMASGRDPQDKVDWMYTVRKGPTDDQYLTGASKLEEEKELDALVKQPGSLFMNREVRMNDYVLKVKDDPLLAIKQRQQASVKQIMANPLEMKKIKESKEVRKALKKLEKKVKKEERKRRRENGEASPEDAPARSESDRRGSEPSDRRDRNGDRDRDADRDRDRDGERDRHSRRHSESSSHRSDSRSSDPHSSSRDRTDSRPSSDRYDRRSSGDSSRPHRPDDRRDSRDTKRPRLTEEEKRKKREEMERDALLMEGARWKKVDDFDRRNANNVDATTNTRSSFIDEMNRSVYTEHNDKLEDRMKRNIHSLQRNNGSALIHEEGGL